MALALWSARAAPAEGPLSVYAYRQMALVQPLLDDFTRETGIVVTVESGQPDSLLARLSAEGPASRADVLLTIDIDSLVAAKDAGVLQPLGSAYVRQVVPSWLRDPDDYWVAQSHWPRAILTAAGETPRRWSYADLAAPAQKGRVCVRSASDIYSTSFMGAAVLNLGRDGATRWARAVVSNLAAPPFKTGKELVAALEAGTCRIALDNAFYVGRLRADPNPEAAKAAGTIGVHWPSGWPPSDHGAVFAISGAALARYSPRPASGRRLLEFLARPDVQARYATGAAEYPVTRSPAAPPAFASLPAPRLDRRSLAFRAGQRDLARAIYRAAGWT